MIYKGNKIPQEALWQYQAVFTQTGVGGGSVRINISPSAGNRIIILTCMIGNDNYAAGRTITADIRNVVGANGYTFGRLLGAGISVDDQKINIPTKPADLSAENVMNLSEILLTGSEQLSIVAASLAQNETVTLAVRALTEKAIPTIDKSESAGTVTITENLNAFDD